MEIQNISELFPEFPDDEPWLYPPEPNKYGYIWRLKFTNKAKSERALIALRNCADKILYCWRTDVGHMD